MKSKTFLLLSFSIILFFLSQSIKTQQKTNKKPIKKEIKLTFKEICTKSFPNNFWLPKQNEKCLNIKEQPTISIIVKLKKEEPELLRLLNSIKYQNYQKYELIFVDKINNKNNLEIIEEFKQNDNRITIEKSLKDKTKKGEVIIKLSPNDMLLAKNSLFQITQHYTEVLFNFRRFSTLKNPKNIIKRNVPKSFCKQIINHIKSGKKVKNFSKKIKYHQLYKDANFCLQNKKSKQYLIPVLKQSSVNDYNTIFFFAMSRDNSQYNITNIDEIILTNLNQVPNFLENDYPMKKEVMEAFGFIPKPPMFKTANSNRYPIIAKDKLKFKYMKCGIYANNTDLSSKYRHWIAYEQMNQKFPRDYNYAPQTYLFPRDEKKIKQLFENYTIDLNNLWILKPGHNFAGNGIKMFTSYKQLKGYMLLSRYISNPHLIHGKKMNMRIFTLISGVNPLRIYIHKEGYVTSGTKKYELTKQSINNRLMHVINSALSVKENKNEFITSGEFRNTITISQYRKLIEREGANFDIIMEKIKDIVIKVLILSSKTFYATISKNGLRDSNFYNVNGFDFLIDSNFEPHFIEVNGDPSFHLGDEIYKSFKDQVFTDAFNIVGMIPFDRTTGKPIEKKKNPKKYKDILEEDIDIAVAELKRPRGDYELLFPRKDTLAKYSVFVEPTKANKKFWDMINKGLVK